MNNMNKTYIKNVLFRTDFLSALPPWAGPLCGLMGAALFLAGTVCFVAYNWGAWGTLYKFALPLVGLAACAAAAYRFGLESGTGKVLSFACGLFVGLFWVVYGQVYQTGAFVYEFCLAWAVCLVPLALLAGNRWLWLLWAAVCNGYLILYGDLWIWTIFNTGCFSVSEWSMLRSGKRGLFSLFFLAAALWFCLLCGLFGGWSIHFWGSLGLMILLAGYAWRFRRGAAQLGFCAFALDILLIKQIVSWFNIENEVVLVLGVLFVFVLSAGAVYALSRREECRD